MIVREEQGFRHLVRQGDGMLLLCLHGTGGSGDDAIGLGLETSESATLVAPDGHVMEGPNRRWFRRSPEGVFDLPDLHARTAELAEFVAWAREEYAADRVIAIGYSNGANIGTSLLLSSPALLDGLVALRGTLPFEPSADLNLAGKRVLIRVGLNDGYSPPDQIARLELVLGAAGADVEVGWSPRGHSLGPEDVTEIRRWLGRA